MTTPTQLRRSIAALTTLAERDLHALWRQVATAAQARQALEDVLPALIETYGVAASAVAADWYDEAREKAGARGRFRAIPAALPDPDVSALTGWALAKATTLETVVPMVTGGMQKRIANMSRLTVMGSSLEDPRSDGWQRVAGPDACTFCRMVAGRGAVFSEATADFGAHDHDQCQAAPAFRGEPRPVKPYTVSPARKLDPVTGKPVPDADFLRAKQWIADHLE